MQGKRTLIGYASHAERTPDYDILNSRKSSSHRVQTHPGQSIVAAKSVARNGQSWC